MSSERSAPSSNFRRAVARAAVASALLLSLGLIGLTGSGTSPALTSGSAAAGGQAGTSVSTTPPGVRVAHVDGGNFYYCGIQANGTISCWGQNNEGVASPPGGTFTGLSAGWAHACALTPGGSVDCWGSGTFGASADQAGPYIAVSAGGSFTGGRHTCAIRIDSTLHCWGSNTSGELTAPSGAFTAVSSGGHHSCAIRQDGTVACWGRGNEGQTSPPAGATFVAVAAGENHTCGIKSDRTLACWGQTSSYTAGPPTGEFKSVSAGYNNSCGLRVTGTLACWGESSTVSKTPGGGSYVHVSSGNFESCGVRSDGTAHCWGASSSAPQPPGGASFTRRTVVAGWRHTCALGSDGVAVCWGEGSSGKTNAPAGAFAAISTRDEHTCGLRPGGSIECWGVSSDGRGSPPAGTFLSVSAGGWHTCGIRSDGTVACWGWMLGATTPAGTFASISEGYHHGCGIQTGGSSTCWGYDAAGQTEIPPGSFRQIGSGNSHACGVVSTGEMKCWGDNTRGVTPLGGAVAQPGTWLSVEGGAGHSCGIKADGTAACWGYNLFGQANAPAGSFATVAVGSHHNCGIKTDGTLTCWGSGTDGRLSSAPHITSAAPPASSGGPYSHTYTATGSPAPKFRLASGAFPPGLSLSSSGVLSGTPTGDGTFTGTVTAYTEFTPDTDSQAFSIEVETNFPPVATAQSATTSENSATTITLAGTDQDSDPVTFKVVSLPANGKLYAGTDALGHQIVAGDLPYALGGDKVHFDPDVDFNGTDSFTFRARDGALDSTAAATVSLRVTPVNDAPTATGTTLSLDEDAPAQLVDLGALAADTETSDANLTYTIVTAPTKGTVTGTGATRAYTPSPNASGSDSFTFSVTDRGDADGCGAVGPNCAAAKTSATHTVAITIAPVNDVPNALDSRVNVVEEGPNVAVDLSLLVDDVETSDQNLTFTIVDPPTKGVLTGTGATRSYNVDADALGEDSFTYRVTDRGDPDACTDGAPACAAAQTSPLRTVTISIARAIDAGDDYTCGLTHAGKITCWGENAAGETAPPAGTFTALAAGNDHACAISSGGSPSCWGSSADGRIAARGAGYTAISAGARHSCALTAGGESTCWGDLTYGQGNGVWDLRFGSISSAGDYTCGIKTDKALFCWGNIGGFTDLRPPAGTFDAVDAGPNHACAIRTDRTLDCWGYVVYGQDAPPGSFISVAAGWDHSCGIRVTGAAVCWGANGSGQAAAPAGTFAAITAGRAHTCGIKVDGVTVCWGSSANDRLGTAVQITSAPPADPAPGAYSHTYTATGTPAPTQFRVASGSLPTGLSLSPSGAITGSPTELGRFTGTVAASNEFFAEGTQAFDMTVTSLNAPPVAIAQAASTPEDAATTLTLAGLDAESSPLTFKVTRLPARGEVYAGAGTDGPRITGAELPYSLPADKVTYVPAPDYNGSDSFGFKTNDGTDDSSGAADVSITIGPVNDAPTAADATRSVNEDGPDVTVDLATVAADLETADANLLYEMTGAAPTNGTRSLTGSVLTFDPDADKNGSDTITYKVTDRGDPDNCSTAPCDATKSATGSISITIDPVNDAPTALDAARSVNEDAPDVTLDLASLAGDLETADGDLAYELTGAAPTNGTRSLTGSVLTFDPDADKNGSDTITYKVTDRGDPGNCSTGPCDAAKSATGAVTITIDPVNDAPAAADASRTVNEDGADVTVDLATLAADLETSDVNLLYELTGAAPSNGTRSLTGSMLTFDPAANANGSDTIAYRVTDRGDPDGCSTGLCDATKSATGSISITVDPVNDAPTAADATRSVDEDGPDVTVDLATLAADLETADVNLLYELTGAAPSNGTRSLTGSVLTFDPAADENGTDTITYKVTDRGDPDNCSTAPCDATKSATGTITITVDPVNDAPTAADAARSVDEDAPDLTLDLATLAADLETSDANLLYELTGAAPTNGTRSLAGSVLTFDPAADENGSDTITYKVTDRGDPDDCGPGACDATKSAAGTVSITVDPVNDAPTAADATRSVDEDGPDVTVDLAALTADLETSDANLAFELTGAAPSNGTRSLTGSVLTFDPAADANGSDAITYKVTDRGDPDGCSTGPCDATKSATATIAITIDPVNDAPTAADASRTIDEDGPDVTVDLATLAADLETSEANLLYELTGAAPTNGARSLTGSVLTFAPDPDANGTDTIAYRVTDRGDPDGCSTGLCDATKSATGTIAITIDPVNDAPRATDATRNVNEDGPDVVVDLASLVTDVETGDADLAFALGGGTSPVGRRSLTGSVLTFDPATNAHGTVTIPYSVTDRGDPDACARPPCDGSKAVDGTVTVVVEAVNDQPAAEDAARATPEDGAGFTIDLTTLADDLETADDDLTFELVAQDPSLGSGSLAGSVLRFEPAANRNGGGTILYKVTDRGDPDGCHAPGPRCKSGRWAVARIVVDVTPVNDAPVARDEARSSFGHAVVSVDLAPLVSDLETARSDLAFSLAGSPLAQGSASLTGSTLTYTPFPYGGGTDVVGYTVTDRGDPDNCSGAVCDAAKSATAEVSVNVVRPRPAPDPDPEPDPDPVVKRTLSLTVTGSGAGSITSPEGIACSDDCSRELDEGDAVTLTAEPADGSTFAGWAGACTGAGTCTVTLDGDRSVTATFERMRHTLSLASRGIGAGSLIVLDPALECDDVCTTDVDHGTEIMVKAAPEKGSIFAGWIGTCSGTRGPCEVTLDDDVTLAARFKKRIRIAYDVKTSSFRGAISTLDPACRAGRKVVLMRKRGGLVEELGSDTTSRSARWKVSGPDDPTGAYWAVLKRKGDCRGGTSGRIRPARAATT